MKTIYPDPWEFSEQQMNLPRSQEEAIQRKSKSYLPYDDATGAFQSCDREHRSAFDIEGQCRQCKYDALVAAYNQPDNVKARAERKAIADARKKAAQIEYQQIQAKAKAEKRAREMARLDRIKAERTARIESDLPEKLKWFAPLLAYRPYTPKRKPAIRKHWIDAYGRVPIKAERRVSRVAVR